MAKGPIRVVCVGIGEMGKKLVQTLVSKRGLQIVGAADIDENHIGKDLADVCVLEKKTGIIIEKNVETVFSKV